MRHSLRSSASWRCPEAGGLCGCWQVIAVERESLDLTAPDEPVSGDLGYQVSNLAVDQSDAAHLLEGIRGHWSAIGNGTHYRRGVTLGEEANRTAIEPGRRWWRACATWR